jgi:hypothetical protein
MVHFPPSVAHRATALGWLLLIGGVMLVPGQSTATAADTEVRAFSITVDGKPAGEYFMTISQQEGSITMSGQAEVKFKPFPLVTYTY